MGPGFAVARLQSGAISTALIGLAGFVAGALVMGLVAFARHPMPSVAESTRTPASTSIPHDMGSPATAPYWERTSPSQAEPFPWPYEGAAPARPPGANRPDRLSAPDGWTYDSATGP